MGSGIICYKNRCLICLLLNGLRGKKTNFRDAHTYKNYDINILMPLYKSSGTKISGVRSYRTGDDYIFVQFTNGATYLYTYSSAGKKNIETMKKLALANKGLSTYISQKKPAYQS